MADSSLTTSSAHSTHSFLTPPNPSFNWFFLLDLIVGGILSLFFLFYFNRLFATLISYGIRAYTWYYYRAYVDIHALQISFLGGRIFFKGVRYHGVNESIFIHKGFITWHYWKRAVKRTDLSNLGQNRGADDQREQADNGSSANDSPGEQGGLRKSDSLPNRIAVTFYGLEWFIYNRTAAYESILAGFGHHQVDGDHPPGDENAPSPSPSFAKSKSEQRVRKNRWDSPVKQDQPSAPSAARSSQDCRPASGNSSAHGNGLGENTKPHNEQDSGGNIGESLSKLIQLLPIKLACTKGAIVVGNENTRSVLTTTFDSATGTIEACNAGPLDLYRQVLSFRFKRPVIQLRPNPDFKQNQLAVAKGLGPMQQEKTERKRKRRFLSNYKFRRRKIWYGIRDLVPYFQSSVESFHVRPRHDAGSKPKTQTEIPDDIRWVGLSRYFDDSVQDDHEGWNAVEYGRISTILDSPNMDVTYYWDIPGRVLSQQAAATSPGRNPSQDINGASPPEWGLDFKIDGGSIDYGPWADRERVGLQNALFPNSYRSSQPAEPLLPGHVRQSTVFKLRVEFNQETSLRIPTREPSKDWQWKGRADAIRGASKSKKQRLRRQGRKKEGEKGSLGPDIRPFGWLSLRVARDSTISYTLDMVASSSGYRNQLTLDLRDSRMSSSVNHGLLWQCQRQLITCDLSNPLSWNALRTWDFKIESKELDLFLLRDHIFLVTDLVSDWGSGPPPDYYTFVPYIYNIDLLFTDFKLFLNVNDLNIISNPSDLDDNHFLVIKGKELTSDVLVPLNKYRPDQNAVDFSLHLRDGGIDVLTPSWNTLHTFMQDKSTATLDSLTIGGTYNYYLSTSSELTDTLVLNVDGASPRLYMFGFLIRSFMTVKTNYFGDEMHFKTLEEFQEQAYSTEQPAGHNGINPNKKSNDLDVIVHVTVDNPCALLPENIYDHLKSLRLNAASIEADLRFTNYYMDLQLSISPLKVSLESDKPNGPVISGTQLFIDGLAIYGHRLFGLPPAEPTYVCNWDFKVGRIIGECSTGFLSCMVAAVQSFDLSYDNEENALPPPHPETLYDVTFLRAAIDSVHISVLLDRAALILSSGPVTAKLNDWTNFEFSKRVSLLVPDISIAAVDLQSTYQIRRFPRSTVTPHALFQMTLELKMAQRKRNIAESRRLQQEHIRIHDQPTERTQWLLFDGKGKLRRSTIAVPLMPEPVLKLHCSAGVSSARHLPGVRSSVSSTSFLISSDASSLKSVRKRTARNVKSMSGPILDTGRIEASALPDRGTRLMKSRAASQTRDGKAYEWIRKDFPASIAGDSNPWAIPHFSLYKTVLDTSHLPSQQGCDEGPRSGSGENLVLSSLEDDQVTQVNFSCEFPSGVKGYCTPQFLIVISEIVREFQPTHPIEIIDSLQKDVISDIVRYEKAKSDPKRSTSFAIRVPSIVLKLINLSDSPNTNHANFRDEYSIGISHLKTEFRARVERRKDDFIEGIKKSLVVHAEAKSLSMSVEGSRADAFQEKAEFNCLCGDINFWLSTAPTVRSHLQMKSFDAITSTKSVEHLAFLVRRTATTIDSVTSSFQHSSPLSIERLRMLVYFLTQSASGIPDPTFLTRISSVLRIAPRHLRQHDSWKIISRLRNVYKNLPLDQQRELASKCLGDDLSLPDDAKSTVLSSFDQWRTWDLAHVEKSYAMQRIWNSFESGQEATAHTPVSLSLTVRSFRFSIDPGPKESDFVVEDLSTAINVSSEKNESQTASKESKKVAVLQSYCSSAALRLRWEILDLVEGIARTMSTVTLESAASPKGSIGKEEEQRSELQIVLGADVGSITLDGINIKLALLGKTLRGSVVHVSHRAEKVEDLSVLLSAGTCSSEFSSLSRTLMLWRVWYPYVYCSQTSQEIEGELANDWKIAASCRKLRYDMKEDLLSLAHTVDRLIEDEVRYIRQLIKDVNLAVHRSEDTPTAKIPTRSQFHIALFLDDYRLNFHLLPSLIYTISGYVARISFTPREPSKFEVDFDLKENFHVFSSEKAGKLHTLSVLDIPPINGRILIKQVPNRTDVEVDTMIELIQLEASALRSLFSVLTGPGISHMVSDIKQNVEILQLHLVEVLDLDKPPSMTKEPSNGHELLYKARLTMAGMEIHVTAPGLNGEDYSADMGLSLGMTQMRIDNGLEQEIPIKYPQFRVDVSRVLFDLRKQERLRSRSYGSFAIDAKILGSSTTLANGEVARAYHISSKNLDVELFAETAVLVVDIASHLQERIKKMDLSHEVKRFKRLRRRGQLDSKPERLEPPNIQVNNGYASQDFFNSMCSLELENVQVAWNMTVAPSSTVSEFRAEDLVFSIRRLDLSNKTKNTAKLRIEDMQLQMVPFSADRRKRSLNSALMPQLVFNVAHFTAGQNVRVAFQAAGKSLDLRVTSDFMIPGSMLQHSIASASKTLSEADSVFVTKSSTECNKELNLFGNKRLQSVLIDVDFAGGIVSLQGRHSGSHRTLLTSRTKGSRISEAKYGQYIQGDAAGAATLRAPGVALKVQFEDNGDDNGDDNSALNAELKVDASTNVLYPTLVPLIKQVTATLEEVMGEQKPSTPSTTTLLQSQRFMQDASGNAKSADSIIGKCKVNVGLLIRKQEFCLSCQPVARVAATAKFDSVYVRANTVQSEDHGRFVALVVAFNFLQASVKHVYSNESTASFEVKSMVMSLMNSKYLNSMSGVSAALKVSPMTVALNAKQVQDFLLFREIWLPSTDEAAPAPTTFQQPSAETQTYIVQRYQQVASASAFPWDSTIAVEKLEIQLDLGSTLGKSHLGINDFWLSSKKTSDWEQTLCVNFNTVGIESKGRMSGLVELRDLKVRTSIQWPEEKPNSSQTPLIQASIKFHQLHGKVSFDYQPFIVADIALFEFLMYNVRGASRAEKERLVSILEGEKVQVYCTTLTASKSMALFQAWQRLAQDKQAAYETSLREVDRFLRRRSSTVTGRTDPQVREADKKAEDHMEKAPISLQTSVVVTLKTVDFGVFPRSFFDNQIFKLEALDAQARFAVSLEESKIHSALGLTLGQLGVALSAINRPASANLDELSVSEVVNRATNSRGGTILKVPRLVASMETWQIPESPQIHYVFRSTFEGKVDVGWNYSRISFIRDMWESHSRALASRLGKPLQPSAVRITGGGPSSEGDGVGKQDQQEKITAVVNVPQSKYTYTALKPPVIETPQLRDMGEATPPLEWIGLQRDKLPNITHQIVIVTLLEVAKEVEDAYGKILGSS